MNPAYKQMCFVLESVSILPGAKASFSFFSEEEAMVQIAPVTPSPPGPKAQQTVAFLGSVLCDQYNQHGSYNRGKFASNLSDKVSSVAT